MSALSFDLIIKSIEISHNPISSQEDRLYAYQIYELLKNNIVLSLQSVNNILYSELYKNEIYLHFSIHLLETIVIVNWKNCNLEQQDEIKNKSFELLNISSTLPKYIKLKISKLICEISKREYPSNWANLITSLLSYNDKYIYVLVDIIECTSEYSFTLSEKRKVELHNGLLKDMDLIFKSLECIKDKSDEYKEDCLNVLKSLVEWVNIKHFYSERILLDLIQMLPHPNLFPIVAEILETVVRKSGLAGSDFTLMAPYVCQIWVSFLDTMELLLTAEFDKKNKFVLAGASLMYQLFKSQIKLICGTSEIEGNIRNRIFKILTHLINYNPEVGISALNQWIFLFKNLPLSQDPIDCLKENENIFKNATNLNEIVRDVFNQTSVHLFNPKEYYLNPDDDEGEATHYGTARGQTIVLLRLISQYFPLLAISLVFERFKNCNANAVGILATHFEGSWFSEKHPVVVEQEACCTLLESVFKHLKAEVLNSAIALSTFFISSHQNLRVSQPYILVAHISALRNMIPVYKASQNILLSVLDFFFNCIMFLPPNLTFTELPDCVKSVRKRACFALLALSNNLASLLPLMDSLLNRVMTLSSSAMVFEFEKTQLYSFLVHISNSFPDRQMQKNFLSQLLSPFIAALPILSLNFPQFVTLFNESELTKRQDIRCLVYNIACVIKGINATENELQKVGGTDKSNDEESLAISAHSVTQSINLNSSILLYVLGDTLSQILPAISTLIALLHYVWTPKGWEKIDRRSLGLSKEEIRIYASSDKAIKEADKAKLAVTPKNQLPQKEDPVNIEECKSWLYSIRDCSYSILETCTTLGAPFYSSLNEHSYANIFSHLSSMDTRHIKLIYDRVLFAFVSNCPVIEYNRILLPVLQVVLSTTFSRLTSEWLSATEEENEISTLTLQQDLMEDRILRELTRSYTMFLAGITIPHAGYGVSGISLATLKPIPPSNTPQDIIIQFLLSQPALYQQIFDSLIACLWWPDVQASRRAIQVIFRFLPIVCNNPTFFSIYSTILTTLISRLMKVSREEADVSELYINMITLTKEIYLQFILHTAMPRDIFLSVPNMISEELQNFEENLRLIKESHEKDTARQSKQLYKLFLEKYVIGVEKDSESFSKRLSEMPETLVLQSVKYKKAAPDWKDLNDFGISKLFGN